MNLTELQNYHFLFDSYGINFVGTFLLATIIGLFYAYSSVKEGLKYFRTAFYTLAGYNGGMFILSLITLIRPDIIIIPKYAEWAHLIVFSITSALLISATLQILHLLYHHQTFFMMLSGAMIFFAGMTTLIPQPDSLFVYLPYIYISISFIVAGLVLILRKNIKNHALRATGISFVLLGLYYLQSGFHLAYDTWMYGATIYSVALMLLLSTQINLVTLNCQTLSDQLQTEKEKRQLILETSPFPVLFSRLVDDHILYINPVAKDIFGMTHAEPHDLILSNYFANPNSRIELLERLNQENTIQSFEAQMKNPTTDQTMWLDLSARIIELDGELAVYMTFKDVTHNKQKENLLMTQAGTDPLTGLLNRRYFEVLAKKQLALSKRNKWSYTVAMLDIDHFKAVNDTYGHDMGDEVLKSLANILNKNLRESDICARYGGEEFVLILVNTSPTEGWQVAERLRSITEQTIIQKDNQSLSITISIGLSATQSYNLAEQIKEADLALYQSKETGRNKTTLFTPDRKQKG